MWWSKVKDKQRAWWGGAEKVIATEVREVHLWANGPLSLTGTSGGGLLKVVGVGRRKIKVQGGVAQVRLWGPMQAQVPAGCTVRVKRVNGPLAAKGLESDLVLEVVNGPVTGRGLAAVQIEQVRGPLSLREVHGEITGESPRGPLTLEDVRGAVRLTSPVRGALALRGVSGPVELTVHGSAHLSGPFAPGAEVRLRVQGEAWLNLPAEDADVHLRARVHGALHTPFAAAPTGDLWEITLGQGAATVDLEVDGDLWVSQGEEAPEEVSEVPDWSTLWPVHEDESARSPAADEERLTVLRLLAQGKITAEQAQRLLEALED